MLLLSDDLVAVSGAASVPFSALGADVAALKQVRKKVFFCLFF